MGKRLAETLTKEDTEKKKGDVKVFSIINHQENMPGNHETTTAQL